MDDIAAQGKDRKAIREELLVYLQILEEDNWMIFGWYHMNLAKRMWLRKPQKLADCVYYQNILKNWLREKRIVEPKKSRPSGLVKYEGMAPGTSLAVESIYFDLWLARDTQVCVLSYGEHKFINNETLEDNLGRARFSIVFKDWLEIIPVVLCSK